MVSSAKSVLSAAAHDTNQPFLEKEGTYSPSNSIIFGATAFAIEVSKARVQLYEML